MGEVSGLGAIGGLDKIAIAANSTAEGLEKVLSVINGLYDNLILYQRAWEDWENKSFNIRAQEIEKQRDLGTISSYDEAMLWKELTNQKEYGWQNVWKAEEQYYQKLYEHSKQWIEDQTRLGKLSADEVAEAWQRVYDKFDNINVKYEAAANIRSVLLEESEQEINARRLDSDRWMQQQDLYDGGDFARQVEDYNRRIAAETALLAEIESGVLNGVELGPQEQNQKWLEVYQYIEDLQNAQYKSAKAYLDMQVNDYIEGCYKKLQEEYNLKQKQYQTELDKIDEYYDTISRKKRQEEWDDQLIELYEQQRYYRNAVTKEGQDKYQSISDQIRNLEKAQYNEDMEQRRKADREEVQQQMQDAKDEYESAKNNMDEMKEKMLNLTGSIAQSSASSAIKIGENIKQITGDITKSIEEIFISSEQGLMQYVTRLSNMIGNVLYTEKSSYSNSNVQFTLNDYGAKNLADRADVFGYAQEMLDSMKNAMRSRGI